MGLIVEEDAGSLTLASVLELTLHPEPLMPAPREGKGPYLVRGEVSSSTLVTNARFAEAGGERGGVEW